MGLKQENYGGIIKYLVVIGGFLEISLYIYSLNLDILGQSFIRCILRLVFILLDGGFQLVVTHIHIIQIPS